MKETLEAFLAEHQPGSVVGYQAFTSGSKALDGYPVDGKFTVLLVIDGKSGHDIDGVGNNFEREVLFARDTAFVIIKVEQDALGRPIVFMREVLTNEHE